MDYFREIKAFYNGLLTNSLTTPEIALWHALMHQNNMLGWPTEFNVPLSTLSIWSGESTAALKRARNGLTTKKYIKWRSRAGNQSAVYTMISLAENPFVAQYEPQNVPQSVPQNVPQSVPQSEPIPRLKTDTKAKDEDTREAGLQRLIAFYESNIGALPRYVYDAIREWTTRLPVDLIELAMQIAVENNVRKWAYARAILEDCEKRNIRTVDAYKTEKGARGKADARPPGKRATVQDAFLDIAGGNSYDDSGGGGAAGSVYGILARDRAAE